MAATSRPRPPATTRPLTDAAEVPLPRLALVPQPASGGPWTLSSELVFLGRSPACGVRVRGSAAARVHAVLVRTPRAAYIVNLVGCRAWPSTAAPVRSVAADGARPDPDRRLLPLRGPPGGPGGRPRPAARPSVPATCRPASPTAAAPPAPPPDSGEARAPWPTELVLPAGVPPAAPRAVRIGHSQAAVLAWMMGVVQATQSEMMRQQHDFQLELIRAIRDLHDDSQTALHEHQDRVEQIHRELSSLREDIRQRFGGPMPAPAAPMLPKGPPIKIPRGDPDAPPADPATATDWLLNRVNQLDEASRSSWQSTSSAASAPAAAAPSPERRVGFRDQGAGAFLTPAAPPRRRPDREFSERFSKWACAISMRSNGALWIGGSVSTVRA